MGDSSTWGTFGFRIKKIKTCFKFIFFYFNILIKGSGTMIFAEL